MGNVVSSNYLGLVFDELVGEGDEMSNLAKKIEQKINDYLSSNKRK